MPSQTDIVNLGLRMIGATTITSLTDGSDSANAAADIFDILLDDILRQNFWNFATKRVKLARSSTAPTFEFQYAYALPSDWIRTVSVHPDTDGASGMFYKEELVNGQRVIAADVEDVYMRYIARITDPNLWSSDFQRAVAATLARDLSIPLASSNSLYDRMDISRTKALARARSTDAMGSSPEVRPRGSWVNRRGVQRPIVGDTQ